MLSPIQRLKQQLESKERPFTENSLIEIHHILMKEYGWIPLEEFKQLPIPTLWNLLNCIKKQHEMEERGMKKGGRR